MIDKSPHPFDSFFHLPIDSFFHLSFPFAQEYFLPYQQRFYQKNQFQTCFNWIRLRYVFDIMPLSCDLIPLLLNVRSATLFEEGERLTPRARSNLVFPPRAIELRPRHFSGTSRRGGPSLFLIFSHDLNAATAARPAVVTASGAQLGEASRLEKLALHDALAFPDVGSVGSRKNPVICELLFPALCLDGHGLGGCSLTRHSPPASDEGAKPRDHRPGVAGISDDEQLAGLVWLGVLPS